MRIISKVKQYYYSFMNRRVLQKNKIIYGENLTITGRLRYEGVPQRLRLGKDITMHSMPYEIPIGYPTVCSFWIMEDGQVEIGDGCGLSNTTICCMKKVTIGKHCLFGGGVKIYDTDFHSLNWEKRRDIARDNDRKTKDVIIEDDVFVGSGSIILKGTKIGERAVIGAGSVVCGEIPAGEIWAGNPARFIRKNDN